MSIRTTTETVFSAGASKHRWEWLECNKLAVAAANDAGLNPADPKVKLALAMTVLRILDRLRPQPPLITPANEEQL